MERMALFIDSYDSVRFHALIDRLDHDAAILQREPRRHSCLHRNVEIQRKLHFSAIQQVQIYRTSPNEDRAPLFNRRRPDDDVRRLMKSLADGIPWLVNLSLRNVTKTDLAILGDSGLYSELPPETRRGELSNDAESESSTSLGEGKVQDQGFGVTAFSELQGILVTMSEGEGVDDGFLESLRRLPKLISASFGIEPNAHFSYPSLLTDHSQTTSDGSCRTLSLKSLNIQQDRIMSGGSNGSSSSHQTSPSLPRTLSSANHIHPLCHSLETSNRTLQSLNLEHDLCQEGLHLMANMVRAKSVLKILSISFFLQDEASNDQAIIAFAEALRVNKKLVDLKNHKANRLRASQKAKNSLLNMLEEDNFVLRVLDLCQEDADSDSNFSDSLNRAHSFRSQKDFYLKLNFWDRQRFLAGNEQERNQQTLVSSDAIDDKAYVDLFHAIRDDLDCIFYFLSRNPSLVTSACLDTQFPPARQMKQYVANTANTSVPAQLSKPPAKATKQILPLYCERDEMLDRRPSKRSRR